MVLSFFLAFLLDLAACSSLPHAPVHQDDPVWRGRMAIFHPGPPPKQDAVSFVLGGTPNKGWLTFQSPLGQALAELTWSNSEVLLREGSNLKSIPDIQAWSQQWLGSALSPQTLFGVLQDPNAQIPNWHIERKEPQHIRITHIEPPKVQIRLIIDERPALP